MAQDTLKTYAYKPEFHSKGWGYEEWIVNNEKYCGKMLHIDQDKACSLHFHIKKHETFYVNKGVIELTLIYADGSSKDLILQEGACFEIPPGLIHRFTAIYDSATIVEFSTQHFEEDSYRVKKGD